MSEILRETRETRVRVTVARGDGRADVATGVPFLDHMLATLARHSGLDLNLKAGGDLRHHVIEDVAIALGQAVRGLEPEGIARHGDRTVAMDDALVHVVVDLGGRAYYRGPVPGSLYEHWMRSFAMNAAATLHVRVLRGRDRHHVIESTFKALGFALRDALVPTGEVFSTKGEVRFETDGRGAGGGGT